MRPRSLSDAARFGRPAVSAPPRPEAGGVVESESHVAPLALVARTAWMARGDNRRLRKQLGNRLEHDVIAGSADGPEHLAAPALDDLRGRNALNHLPAVRALQPDGLRRRRKGDREDARCRLPADEYTGAPAGKPTDPVRQTERAQLRPTDLLVENRVDAPPASTCTAPSLPAGNYGPWRSTLHGPSAAGSWRSTPNLSVDGEVRHRTSPSAAEATSGPGRAHARR